MPKKKNPETPDEQAKRFRREARKLISAGDLSPEEGENALDRLVRKQRPSTGDESLKTKSPPG